LEGRVCTSIQGTVMVFSRFCLDVPIVGYVLATNESHLSYLLRLHN